MKPVHCLFFFLWQEFTYDQGQLYLLSFSPSSLDFFKNKIQCIWFYVTDLRLILNDGDFDELDPNSLSFVTFVGFQNKPLV